MSRRNPRKPTPNAAELLNRDRPLYEDGALIGRICERIEQGASYTSASMCEGMSRDTVKMWIHRAKDDGAPFALVEAVTAIARARGDFMARLESRVGAGDATALHWLERQERDEWGRAQTVTVEGIDPSKAVAAALARIGDAPAE